MAYVYILECKDGTLYTGWTTNIEERVKKHNEGKGAKYTRGRTPVELRYLEILETKQDAMRREYEIKKLSRQDKKRLFKVEKLDNKSRN
ncbi:GIY-YIG domain-containing protein [Gottschalkia purinilytica]|uniref:GIY-YIG domain-containing protein n=1 Tax=Gottschalkia purinilytica TaxID=1503 RepID=A0A0L0WCL0_GOTPU|nr:GIY-YIG nuclease family protein [Gottschalkia purinilytica]KNF09150.1 GIY-YIG domain-containing protein [Gottschalkia purinilytica]